MVSKENKLIYYFKTKGDGSLIGFVFSVDKVLFPVVVIKHWNSL